ncbi:hypothetical protein LIER_39147 [Lithospermum erythrorhizon]|uniref:Polyprotein n=1 Tax=Lithospermum erythrorhizon TaxID=34254 RepID=A0AAV3QB50_LITER
MKDFGKALYILGIQIYRDRATWLITHCKTMYINGVLLRFRMVDSKKGSIMYAMLCIVPKQSIDADSTTKAKYIATSEAIEEACWINKFEPCVYHKSKHILKKYHLIREKFDRGDIKVCKVAREAHVADLFTKPLPQQKHDEHASKIGLRQMSQWC